MPNSSPSTVCTASKAFSERDIAFALAWEVHAPGLGGWSVTLDGSEEGADMILVDPPLVYGNGFELRPHRSGVVITSPLGTHRAGTLRDALLLICPLAPTALEAADALAAVPEPAF